MLLRGVQKQVIVLQDTGSEFFDQAFFIVSPKGQGKKHCDMVAAARGIVDSRLRNGRGVKREKNVKWMALSAGIASTVTLAVTLLAVYLLG